MKQAEVTFKKAMYSRLKKLNPKLMGQKRADQIRNLWLKYKNGEEIVLNKKILDKRNYYLVFHHEKWSEIEALGKGVS
jgi:hypothetical protein